MNKTKQPRKQRKEMYNADLHKRRKRMGAILSEELRKKHSKRNIPVRKGDKVEIMRGKFKKKQGKITKVNLKRYVIYIENIVAKKANGTEKPIAIQPSNVRIVELNLGDKERVKIMERKSNGK